MYWYHCYNWLHADNQVIPLSLNYQGKAAGTATFKFLPASLSYSHCCNSYIMIILLYSQTWILAQFTESRNYGS